MEGLYHLKQAPKLEPRAGDSKYLTKLQIKKAQFLFENDYFIWNEAEMYLRYHDIFTTIPDSDPIYEDLCKTTRVVFNLIHGIHFKNASPNVAYLKFHELLDAWGSLSEYVRIYDVFPKPFLEWFKSIFMIYQSRDQTNISPVVLLNHFVNLYTASGVNKEDALNAFFKITNNNKLKLTFEFMIQMIKEILLSDDEDNRFHLLVPQLQDTLKIDKFEKPYEKVLRNYDYNKVGKSYSKSNLAEAPDFIQVTKPVLITDVYTASLVSPSNIIKINVPINQNTFNKLTTPIKAEFNDKHLNDIYEQIKFEQTQYKSSVSKSSKTNCDSSYEINGQYFQTTSTEKVKIPPKERIEPKKYNITPISFPEIDRLFEKIEKIDTELPKVLCSDSFKKENSQSEQNSSNSLNDKSQFRLADFRREFKRSVKDLNKNLSRSINALDFLEKLSIDPTENTKLSTSSSSDCRFNKTLDETLLCNNAKKKNTTEKSDFSLPQPRIQVVHKNVSDLPIRDIDNYGLSTSFSSNSNFEIRVPKNVQNLFSYVNSTTTQLDYNNKKSFSEDNPLLVSMRQEGFYSSSSNSSTTTSSSGSSSSRSNVSIKKIPIQTHKLQQQTPLSFLETQESVGVKGSNNEVKNAQASDSNNLFKSSLKKQSKYDNTETDNQPTRSMQQREFKARSVSTITPRKLDISIGQQQSPNVSYRNSSHDPKSHSRISAKIANSGIQQQNAQTRHKYLNSLSKGNRSVRYELNDNSEKIGHGTQRSETQKSKLKELGSNSSLDTLNDIDTENINTQIVDEEKDITENGSKYDNCNYYGGYYNACENMRNGFDQEWSYSLKDNSQCLSVSDQRIVNEILRKLKPIVKKNVKKQIKYYMEKRMLKELKKTGFRLSKDTTNSFTNHEEF